MFMWGFELTVKKVRGNFQLRGFQSFNLFPFHTPGDPFYQSSSIQNIENNH